MSRKFADLSERAKEGLFTRLWNKVAPMVQSDFAFDQLDLSMTGQVDFWSWFGARLQEEAETQRMAAEAMERRGAGLPN